MTEPFVPPVYPYEQLGGAKEKADAHPGGAVDLSVGTPNDPPPPAVVEALATSDRERGYPPSIGTPELKAAIRGWLDRRFGVDVPAAAIAACVGTKEFVGTLPQWLKLRRPDRDTVLYPAVETIIAGTKPEIIIIHPCGARWDGDLITMDAAEAVATCRLAPDATVIATHMESLDHTTVSRDELRRYSTEQGVSPQQLLIPLDGETLQLASKQP